MTEGLESKRADPPQAAPAEKPFAVSAPAINLPKGGGAIRGMGEKFAANPVTGTGSMSIPIATGPGRNGFGPQFSLSYDSGAGNGPFGFGWSLSLPSVTRKTDKGLPRYRDAEPDPLSDDVFVLSGAEDLVPVLRDTPSGRGIEEDLVDGYRVRRYRPRIEGLFACIERWTKVGVAEDVHWRSISTDNILTIYGLDRDSRIFDPEDPSRIYSWLICESRDDKGNGVRYLYKAENGERRLRPQQSDPLLGVAQRNRGVEGDIRRTAQRYLHRVLYGNVRPLLDTAGQRPRFLASLPQPPTDTAADWLFEVRFDYGELHDNDPTRTPERKWLYRPDAFSSYRAGFEVRTCRRCERVLMLHHIPGADGYDGAVRSTDFTYDDELDPSLVTAPVYSFLQQVTQTAWQRDGGAYRRRSLPPVEFTYTRPVIDQTVREIDAVSLENLPIGFDGAEYRWVDLHGEGVPGVLHEFPGGWSYKRNLSPLTNTPRFAPLEIVALRPDLALADGAEFMDLAGDGHPDVAVMGGPTPGFYEHDGEEGWKPFRPFTSRLDRDLRDPNLKLIDLDGDGHADVLVSEDDALIWHASLAEEGFGPAQTVLRVLDEEKGPRVVFGDATQSIYLADMSGDGLTDIVRIRNGEVCYWPNLGYGRFGAKISMDDAPWFDEPDLFHQKRVRLADLDGSGTADLVYLHRDGVRLYFNQSGNGWSDAKVLEAFPRLDDVVSVTPTDLLGNGTACLVWSSSSIGDERRPVRYVDLMGGIKPHLLIKTINNLGAETRVGYAPSTKFYLADKLAGRPWITRLAFPVHVVERVETIDHISRSRFVSRYAYHHGCFDGGEREFRGFGMVEQWDTERLDAVTSQANPAAGYLNESAVSTQPPIHTKTWFHTGVNLDRDRISDLFADEYYRPAGTELLPDTPLPTGLTPAEIDEACRALKGMMLRQEVYADDVDHAGATQEQIERALRPYSVTEQNFTIRRLQEHGPNHHAVFLSHPHEALTYHYERRLEDPRTQHAMTLAVDDYGNVLQQAAIGYGRRSSPLALDWDRTQQTGSRITFTENVFTNAVRSRDTYRTPLPCESITYELTGYTPTGAAGRFQASDLQVRPGGAVRRRTIEHLRTRYRPDDMGAAAADRDRLLPLGQLESLALPGESYKLAFTPEIIAAAYQRRRVDDSPEDLLPNADRATVLGGRGDDQGGYVDLDGDGRWWLPSGRSFFSPGPADTPAAELAAARKHFFAARRYRNPFGQHSFVDHDPHDLLIRESRDTLDNRVTVLANDYRVLQPTEVQDPNGNRSEVALDVMGLVVATAVMGKASPAPVEGDSLAGLVTDPTAARLAAFFTAPTAAASRALLAQATSRIVYDLDRFMRTGEPPVAATIVRETHVSEEGGRPSRLQVSFSYSDGFGREIQTKIQAEPGPLQSGGPVVDPRWVGSGWTVFNNKGKPVRQYEPFFSATHSFEFGVSVGVSPILFYDPVDRVVATLHPNHTWEKVVFDPWRQTTWDVNDTVALFTLASRTATVLDPATDPDVGAFFRRLPSQDYRPTWYERRIDAALAATHWPDVDAIGAALPENIERRRTERLAAEQAAAHAATPSTTHFDALGRPFLSEAHHRVVCAGHGLDGKDERFCTRTTLDIEGNQLAVRDAIEQGNDPLGRVVMEYAYDLLGNRIHQSSMEAGARWMLNDVTGKPIRSWDNRDHVFTTVYDALRRPVRQFVKGTSVRSDPSTLNPPNGTGLLIDEIIYGEPARNASAAVKQRAQRLNLRTRVLRHRDSAGVLTNAVVDAADVPQQAYDFKGNLLCTTRQLIRRHEETPDWSRTPLPELDAERFESFTRYDALNRPIQSVAPHSSIVRAGRSGRFNVVQPVFNEANLLERVDVWLEQASKPGSLIDATASLPSPVGVRDIDYDAKGQRLRIDYKNGVSTSYDYDPLTFRLESLRTTRKTADFPDDDPRPAITGWPGRQVQNLHYTYDPAGNIVHLRDDAQQAIYFKNTRIDPTSDYVYDSLYRLIKATGREHLGQGGVPMFHSHDDSNRSGVLSADPAGRFAANDRSAMGRYIERYVYDAVGNFLQMQHERTDATVSGWTRRYSYNEKSLTEPTKTSNRLTNTRVGSGPLEPHLYDIHGNMLRMEHLNGGAAGSNMEWDHKDRLRKIDLGGGGYAVYVYDASGQRVRKVVVKNNGNLIEERIYLGAFEVYRKHSGANGSPTLQRERETLHVMDDKQRIALVEMRTLPRTPDPADPLRLIRYQIGNHLSSTSLELDDTAQIISYEEYSPYGSTTYQAVRSLTEAAKRYRYTGKERDSESELNYHSARYYAPWLGRWTKGDAIGIADSINVYQYARQSPIMRVDLDGHNSKGATASIGDIAPYNEQGKAIWNDGVRGSEHEHVIPRGNQEALVYDRATGLSDYGDAQYRRNTTLTVERETANSKTHGNRGGINADNPRTARLKAKARAGQPINYREEVFLDSIDNMRRAAMDTSSKVTNGQINEAALAQDGELFELQRMETTGKRLAASSAEVDAAIESLEFESKPAAKPVAEPSVVEAPAVKPMAEVSPATPQMKASVATQPKPGARVRAAGGTGLKVLGALGIAVAAKDVIKNVKEGNYGGALVTTGVTALGFTPLAPVVMAAGVVAKYHTDTSIEERSFAEGAYVQQQTGSVVLGGLVSAGTAVGLSIYGTGADFAHGIKGLFTDPW